jgi:membrane-bound serine protease (ClpP class)
MASVAVKSRRRAVVIGESELIGTVAQVVETAADGGWARIHGENWRVVSKTPLRPGQKVRVVARDGLVLEVAPIGNNETGG